MTKEQVTAEEFQNEAAFLAAKFALVLADWLTVAEFAEMQSRNATPEYRDRETCASHDFCDANMAMEAAFTDCFGREPRFGEFVEAYGLSPDAKAEAEDAALWNAAWDKARVGWLTAK